MNTRLLTVVMVCAVIQQCGCRTDPQGRRAPRPGAVLTSMESVELARQSDMSLADAGEVDLVEQLYHHRHMYTSTLQRLREYYQQHGYGEKFLWAQGELEDVERIRPYHYLLDSDIARSDLRPAEAIPQADTLYDEARRMARDAGHGTPALYHQEKMGQALQQFKKLIREYPTSDKIDDAAFYCGEIYKEYFKNQDSVAVEWYRRAWTWDPQTPHPARFQAAVVYDYRLHDRERALELYRAAMIKEPHFQSNTRYAVERIKQLTGSGPVEGHRATAISPPANPQAGQRQPTVPEQQNKTRPRNH